MGIESILNIGSKIIDKLFPDKNDAQKYKLELLKMQQDGEFKELEAQKSIILAEASSQDKWTSRGRVYFLYVMYIFILAMIPIGLISMVFPGAGDEYAKCIKNMLNGIPSIMWEVFGAGYFGYLGHNIWAEKLKKSSDAAKKE